MAYRPQPASPVSFRVVSPFPLCASAALALFPLFEQLKLLPLPSTTHFLCLECFSFLFSPGWLLLIIPISQRYSSGPKLDLSNFFKNSWSFWTVGSISVEGLSAFSFTVCPMLDKSQALKHFVEWMSERSNWWRVWLIRRDFMEEV